MNNRSWMAAFALLIVPLAAACTGAGADGNSNVANPPGPGDVPEKVAIAASTVTSGVSIGTIRRTSAVGAFQIAKHPVTAAQFRACVAAGGCAKAQEDACVTRTAEAPFDRPTTELPGGEQLPATCVGVAQAKAFCAWAGGKLPSLPQFLLAARGPTVTRFAWGEQGPTCGQRSDARSTQPGGSSNGCNPGERGLANFAVGGHPAGASPLGVEDVLLSPGEVLDVSSDTYTTACLPPVGACVGYGLRPGAIDGFEPISAVENATARHAYGFRCVWN